VANYCTGEQKAAATMPRQPCHAMPCPQTLLSRIRKSQTIKYYHRNESPRARVIRLGIT